MLHYTSPMQSKINLGDPELELIDPTPNVHTLFVHFDKMFFYARLASRAVVRWSKRMYSCAGICSYEGRGGLIDIALSEPLLKLRPRKDLVETLLHEMIHAYLFVTCRDQNRDGHGPNFQEHMHRINKCAGVNITIYHDFHDEVKLYQTHWWRCNGPCQKWKPHFGIVRRTMNKAPGPTDFWWNGHSRQCGGTFVKIKEPEKKEKKSSKTTKPSKSTGDITKYINNNVKTVSDNAPNVQKPKAVLKDSNSIPVKCNTKSNSASTVVVTQKGTCHKANSPVTKPLTPFSGKGQSIKGRSRSNSVDVAETVRNVWANKQLSTIFVNNKQNPLKPTAENKTNSVPNRNKHKAESVHIDSPPTKIKKIDDYFKNAATVLKDLYGQDFNITQSKNDNKLVAVPISENDLRKLDLVDCPICNAKVASNEINRHLDECLNKEVIDTVCKDNDVNIINTPNNLKEIVGDIPPIPTFKVKSESERHPVIKTESNTLHKFPPISVVDLTDIECIMNTALIKTEKVKFENETSIASFESNNNRVKEIVKNIKTEKHVRKSDNFNIPKEEKTGDFKFVPSFLDDMACKIETPLIKVEPGTSKDIVSKETDSKCACCGNKVDKPIEEHLDECLAFFINNATIPEEGASTSFTNETILIDDDDDDLFDESLLLNATGTMSPCPCCLKMVEEADMNNHLDRCLN